jgi:hypothetical protein
VQQLVEPLRRIPSEQVIAVAVDAGKAAAVALVADFTGERLCPPFTFALNRSGVAELAAVSGRRPRTDRWAWSVAGWRPAAITCRWSHRGLLPAAWEAVEFNPAYVAEQPRPFPGLTGCLHRVMVTRVGRLVVADFSDPDRLARLGVTRFRRYAARRGLRVTTAVAERLVAAARQALPAADAPVAP